MSCILKRISFLVSNKEGYWKDDRRILINQEIRKYEENLVYYQQINKYCTLEECTFSLAIYDFKHRLENLTLVKKTEILKHFSPEINFNKASTNNTQHNLLPYLTFYGCYHMHKGAYAPGEMQQNMQGNKSGSILFESTLFKSSTFMGISTVRPIHRLACVQP